MWRYLVLNGMRIRNESIDTLANIMWMVFIISFCVLAIMTAEFYRLYAPMSTEIAQEKQYVVALDAASAYQLQMDVNTWLVSYRDKCEVLDLQFSTEGEKCVCYIVYFIK